MFNRDPFITAIEQNDGWAAVVMGGPGKVVYTGMERFPTREEAAVEAKKWAWVSGLKYRE